MKKRILIAVAVMALALSSVPDTSARAWGGWHGLNLRLAGAAFITSSEDGRPTPLGGVFTSMANGIVKGGGGSIFSATVTAEAVGPDGRCGDMLFGADLSTTIVVTQQDGSILSLETGPASYFCTDGTTFWADFEGTVSGGVGRYEGATGTWTGTAEVAKSKVTARINVDLD